MSGRSATAATPNGEPLVLVEANIGEGVVAAPLSKYAHAPHPHLPPDRLDEEDRARVCAYAAERIGFDYDLKNISTCCAICFRCRCRSAGAAG